MTQFEPIYQHAKRPEWGYCAIIDTQDDRTTFKFDDGLSRTIRHDHMHMMLPVVLGETEATEIRKRIAKHSSARVKVNGKAKAKPAVSKQARPSDAPEAPQEATGRRRAK